MNLKFARQIEQEAVSLGLEVRMVEDYSGRGMYGQSTAALGVDSMGNLLAAVAAAAATFQQGQENELEAFIEALGEVRIDSLGRGSVIY